MENSRPSINFNLARESVREIFGLLLVILVVGLLILPVVTSLNEALTQFVVSLRGYRIISEYVIPAEVRWVAAVLKLFGQDAQAGTEYIILGNGEKRLFVEFIWNCVGWQSLLMFIITAIVVFKRGFTLIAKLKALVFGFLGTILVNILRISLVILVLRYFDYGLAQVFHDYGALITNTAWLLVFWWFTYKFVLEETAESV